MSVTEQDRERAVRLLVAIPDSTDRVSTVAQALAEERERARAPFLAVAADYEAISRRRDLADGHRATCRGVADRIRHAAQEDQ